MLEDQPEYLLLETRKIVQKRSNWKQGQQAQRQQFDRQVTKSIKLSN